MAADTIRNNLGEWANQPIVQDQVIAYMEQLGAPALLREIYRPLGLPRQTVNRVLGRLHAKGVVTRWKIPVDSHRPDPKTRTAMLGAVTRECFLYEFADEASE
ncbi:MarR family transcriptional regulator [Novosphingobium sp. G106]|uniref:MarR family transcriptional regulator n=1 Tax=Novosphingobium sp. G106 TaxID=2849500 RepID=UPI001C2D7707|nr:MarR family transcriptional regulator [Novosphingobium sp. G106]MBV1687446.1 MarR family transcriptional regulator [Novosphingobium sp. G106]